MAYGMLASEVIFSVHLSIIYYIQIAAQKLNRGIVSKRKKRKKGYEKVSVKTVENVT